MTSNEHDLGTLDFEGRPPNSAFMFTNPPASSAGLLVEQSGAHSVELGGVSVSRGHANLLVYTPPLIVPDVWWVLQVIRRRVHETHGVELEPDVKSSRVIASACSRHQLPETALSKVEQAVALLARSLAVEIAKRPDALSEVEWRDLERLVAELLRGLGFVVHLTRSSRDGGRDIVVSCDNAGRLESHAIELKHWRSGKKVGPVPVAQFVRVVAREHRHGGVLISTSGFTPGAVEAVAAAEQRRIVLAGREAVASLCQAWVRAQQGLWRPVADLTALVRGNWPNG